MGVSWWEFAGASLVAYNRASTGKRRGAVVGPVGYVGDGDTQRFLLWQCTTSPS